MKTSLQSTSVLGCYVDDCWAPHTENGRNK